MTSFYIYFPSYKIPKTLRNTQNYCLQCYYKYSLKLYLLLQNTLSQSEATEPPGTVTSLSSNSLSESGKYLARNTFPMCSRGHLIPSPRLRASAAVNKLLWIVYTHKESYKVFRNVQEPLRVTQRTFWWLTRISCVPPYSIVLCINTRLCLHQ